MKTITIASRKGGVAKTTTLIQWAVCAAVREGKRVVIVDLDPQGSAIQWFEMRQADEKLSEKGDLHCDHIAAEDLADFKAWAEGEGVDVLLIDTRPDVERPARTAIEIADLLVTPCGTMVFDAAAIGETLEIAREVKTPAAILITRAHPSSRLKREIRDVLEQYGVPICPKVQREYTLIQRLLSHGLGTVEYEPTHKASQDAMNSWEWINAQIGGQV